jgi:cytochrome c5
MKAVLNVLMAGAVLALAAATSFAQESGQKAASAGTVLSIELPNIQVQLKEGEGRIKVETHCAVCHSTDYIPMQPKLTRAQWAAVVTKMIKTFGAQINQEDADRIINYLSAGYGMGN